jgi:hypothetical protein|tara:strand:+ start:2249 stop:2413 length:165 start_codon:yes stop_codon:yes gene_type:complete
MEFRELSLPIKITLLSLPFLIGGALLYFPSENIQGAFMLLNFVIFLAWLVFEKK